VRILEVCGHHSNDAVGPAIQLQGLREDVLLGGEHRLPKGMTDDDNTVVAGKTVRGIDGAP
jgi:hypothetical protein